MPGALLAAFGIMLLAGVDMPGIVSSPVQVLIFLALFWLAGAAEEVGWTGYATGPLIQRYGVFRAGVVLGLIWTIWHLIPFFQTGRGALWILMHCFVTVELRVVMVWLFTRTHGSVAAATIFHAMSNVSFFLFPALGSHYDPAYLAPVLALIIAAAFCWPSKHREGSD